MSIVWKRIVHQILEVSPQPSFQQSYSIIDSAFRKNKSCADKENEHTIYYLRQGAPKVTQPHYLSMAATFLICTLTQQ